METASPLALRRIMIVEDEYMIADDLAWELRHAGAHVVGPAASLPQAMDLLADTPLDAAILDINLRETMAYPLLDALMAQDVRLLVSTGYDEAMIPERYRALPRCEKPTSPQRIRQAAESLFRTGWPLTDTAMLAEG